MGGVTETEMEMEIAWQGLREGRWEVAPAGSGVTGGWGYYIYIHTYIIIIIWFTCVHYFCCSVNIKLCLLLNVSFPPPFSLPTHVVSNTNAKPNTNTSSSGLSIYPLRINDLPIDGDLINTPQ